MFPIYTDFDYSFYVAFHFDIAVITGGRHCLGMLLLIEHMSSWLHVLMYTIRLTTYTNQFYIGYWCVVPQKHVFKPITRMFSLTSGTAIE